MNESREPTEFVQGIRILTNVISRCKFKTARLRLPCGRRIPLAIVHEQETGEGIQAAEIPQRLTVKDRKDPRKVLAAIMKNPRAGLVQHPACVEIELHTATHHFVQNPQFPLGFLWDIRKPVVAMSLPQFIDQVRHDDRFITR